MTERRALHQLASTTNVLFNPTAKPDDDTFDDVRPLVIDLTMDVANLTSIRHTRTKEVCEILSLADVIVTDTDQLAQLYREKYPEVKRVISAPFAAPKGIVDTQAEGVRIGLLNSTAEQQIDNKTNISMLAELGHEYLVYGEELVGLNQIVIDDLTEFAGRLDILLLPSDKKSWNSITDVMTCMAAGCIVIAYNSKAYYQLSQASGVKMMTTDRAEDWQMAINYFLSSVARLPQLKDFNRKWVRTMSTQSVTLVERTVKAAAEAIEAAKAAAPKKKKKVKEQAE